MFTPIPSTLDRIRQYLRASPWLVVGLLFLMSGSFFPARFYGLAYMCGIICLGGYLGFWLHRSMIRKSESSGIASQHDEPFRALSRAIVIAASILGMAIAAAGGGL